MRFFDLNNEPITADQWRKTYQPYYFLGGPTYGRTLNSRNQSSKYVESEIEKLLNRSQSQRLTFSDLKLFMAWKLGAVDHKLSQAAVVFQTDWEAHLTHNGPWGAQDFSSGIRYLCQHMKTLELQDASEMFDSLQNFRARGQLPKFGPVYCLTVIYFMKHGQWPIFDKFAWIAVHAILTGAKVGTRIDYPFDNRSPEWADYLDYVAKVKTVFGRQDIPRQDDQALWVYGHFF